MKQKDLLLLLISTFILVLVWIGFSIHHNSVTSTIPESLNIQILPIDPNFDLKTIEIIKAKKEITPLYDLEEEIEEKKATESPELSTEIASPSSVLLENPNSTSEGEIIQ